MHYRILTATGVLFLAFTLAGCAPAGAKSNEKGLEAYKQGSYEEAVGLFTEAITQNGKKASYYINLGQTYYALARYEEALETFETAMNLKSDLFYSLRGAGMAAAGMENYSAALDYYDKALSEASGKSQSCDILGYRAIAKTAAGDYDGAAADYLQLIDNNYRKRDIYQLLGDVRLKSGDADEAMRCYQECLNIDNRDYDGYLNMAESLSAAGESERAEIVLNAALEVEPREAKDWYYRGRVYLKLEDVENAFPSFEEAYNKGCSEAGYYLGYCYELQDNYDEAMKLYQEQLGINDQDARLYDQMAVCYIRQGKYDDAMIMIEKGLSIESDDVKAALLWNECICFEKKGDTDTALLKLMNYVSLYPKDERAIKELKFLQGR